MARIPSDFFKTKLSCIVIVLGLIFFLVNQNTVIAQNTGSIQTLVIMIDFNDVAATYTPNSFQSLFFSANNKSVTDYYYEVSYGQLNVLPAIENEGIINDGIVGWLRLNQNHPDCENQLSPGTCYQILASSAIQLADPYVDFSLFDSNGDNTITPNELSIVIVAAGYEVAYRSIYPGVWAHAYQVLPLLIIDGKSISDYAMFGEIHYDHQATIGVMAHELGHLMFKLPDLYDRDSTSRGLGNWSLMAGGSWNGAISGDSPAHFDAWSKKKLGWVKPTLATSGTLTIPQVETNKSIYKLCSNTPGQYFLLENRQKIGFDSYLPGDGLAIYHIDDNILTQNDKEWYPGCTTCTSHYKIALEQADSQWDLEKNVNSGDNGDLYPGIAFNTSFTATSKPNSKDYSGQKTGLSVTKISASSATMSASVSTTSLCNNIYVTDNDNSRVQIFSMAGQFVSQFGSYGTDPGQFRTVNGIAIDDTQVYVIDTFDQRVNIFTRAGAFVSRFGSYCSGYPDQCLGQFAYPAAIAVDKTQIYVTENDNSRVQIFDKTGVFVSTFGSYGTGPGHFFLPLGIAVDDANIYVADESIFRVQVFTKAGGFVFQFGPGGTYNYANFFFVMGVAVDDTQIYVVDRQNNRIEIFKKDGTFVSQFGSYGTKPGQFQSPKGIAVDDARIYVVDQLNNRVQIFDKTGNFVSQFGSYGTKPGQFSNPAGIAIAK